MSDARTTSAWRRRLARVDAWWFAPTDAIRLDVFAWLLGWALLLYTLAWSGEAAEWLTVEGFHPGGAAMHGQQLRLAPLPAGAQTWFLAPYFVALVAMILGGRALAPAVGRTITFAVFVGLLYVTGIDRLSAFTFNKLTLVSMLVLAFAPIERNEAGGRTLRSAWPLRILQITIVLQFFGAGMCKLTRGDWWAHSDVLWMQVQGAFRTDFAAWLLHALPKSAWTVMQWLALGFELLAPVLLIVPRLRPLAFVWGGGMLALIGVTMYQVGYFALMMSTFFVLFVDPATLEQIRRRLP